MPHDHASLRAARRAPAAAFVLAAALACGGAAQAAPVTCTGGAAAVPVLDPQAASAELGAYTLDCGGGAPGDAAVAVSLSLFLNVALLGTSTPLLTAGAASYAGTLAGSNQVNFSGVTLDPAATLFSIGRLLVDPGLNAPGFSYIAFATLVSATPVLVDGATQTLAVNGEPASVPEPGAPWLLAAAGLAWLGTRRRPAKG